MAIEQPTRVLLITGASSGIGAAIARQALATGYRVALAARSITSLTVLTKELGGPERVLALPCDVSQWADQQAMVAAVLAHFGQLDVVVANAAVLKGSFSFFKEAATPDEWREMVLTNVYGAALTARVVLPELVKRKGHLVFTGSIVGREALPGELYSATKLAVDGLAESIRKELIGTGVRITVVRPGRVATPFGNPDELPDMPLLKADDVAQAVLYATGQPPQLDISEIVLRPTGQTI